MNETVTITVDEYKELLDAERKLLILEAYGVDNWHGYADAMEEFYQDNEEEE